METNKSMRLGKEDSVPRPELSKLEKAIKPKSFSTKYPTWVSSRILMAVTSFYSSLGDFLFGFDQGIMAGLLVNDVFKDRFFRNYMDSSGHISPNITGITVACLQVSAGTAALSCSRLCEILGRRYCMRIGGFLYFIAAFIQAFSPGLPCFIVGRTIQGFGVGFLSMTVPVIQSEIAAGHRRGLMVGIEFTFNIIGYATSCWVDYGFFFHLPSNMSWQGPFFVQCSIAFLLLSLSVIVPETPRWLAANDFPAEALQTLANFMEMEVSKTTKLYERHLGSASWTEMFTIYRHRTFMAMTGQMFAQLNGINVISFYLASSLSNAGFSTEKSLLYAGYNSIVYILATLPTWYSNGMFAFVVVYNAIFGATWGPIPWLLPAEVFPLRARAKGMSLATIANWCFNFAIGMSSPAAFAKIKGYYYLIIVGFCLISLAMVKFMYVETARFTLEEIAIQFGDRAFEHEDRLELRDVVDSHKPVENKV
ncbi:hypothetical protein V1506DRAFT_569217 [Lipomyces tetrasporus]